MCYLYPPRSDYLASAVIVSERPTWSGQKAMLKTLRRRLSQPNSLTVIIAMLCLTAIELAALSKGIDGAILTTIVGFIASLGGYWLGRNGHRQMPEPSDGGTEVSSS